MCKSLWQAIPNLAHQNRTHIVTRRECQRRISGMSVGVMVFEAGSFSLNARGLE